MKRVAILLSKNLTIGQASNVSAILGGAITSIEEGIHDKPIIDKSQVVNSAVRYSHLLLKGGEGQICNLIQQLNTQTAVKYIAFSREGQELFHSQFDEYKIYIEANNALTYIAVGMIGEDEDIRKVTKKFSLL